MDTIAPKTPATLPFAAWQSMAAAEAAHTVHARIAALPENLRQAALAWVRPEAELAAELGRFETVGGALCPESTGATDIPSGHKAPTADAPLARLPYLLKDLFDLAGVPTRAGSTFLHLARGTATHDSRIASRLTELGAACAGKTHLVEFAAGLFGDNAHYGDCPHPQFSDRLSGGSSSGSAALVAAGVVPFAIGTDTGGSVRVPAAFCGLYGFRLTPGDNLIRDALPLSPSMDTVGWFTANATDMLLAWQALANGKTSPPSAGHNFRGSFLPSSVLDLAFDPATAAACDRASAALAPAADADSSARLRGSWHGAVEAYTITVLSEAHHIHRDWLAPYREHYEPGIWQRFSVGGNYSPEQLAQAKQTMAKVREIFRHYFTSHDYLILPATPFPAIRKAEGTPEARQQLLTLTTPASLAGLPVLSLPVPLASGLTTGLQIILPAVDSPVVPWILSR
jgi:amidase/aspartyl-tRNA(Asn)/glutamyl-tRNA(Gln) amidotransferase subunit A